MTGPQRTQKQISEKYQGNVGYFRQRHFLRSAKLMLFIIAVVASLGVAFGFRYFGNKSYLSTGPISANHARFANRCEVCHTDADADLIRGILIDSGAEKMLPASMKGTTAHAAGTPAAKGISGTGTVPVADKIFGYRETLEASGMLSQYDRACIKCHEPFQLHMPQTAALGLRNVYNEISLVHAGSCSTCHREHQGPEKMAPVASNNCRTCHSDANRLAQDFKLVRSAAKLASTKGEVRNLGDGVRRFIPPRAANHQPVAFASFEKGHPEFGFNQASLRDPSVIRYNHERHEQADIPAINGKKLECTECHKQGADGKFMAPVVFELHCSRCHSLNFDPDTPQIAIPHGDPEKVRAYLRSLTSVYVDYATSQKKITDRAELEAYVRGQFQKLHDRGMNTAEELERRVFITGDPPETPRISTKSNKGQFFPGCQKCHDLQQPPSGAGAPRVIPTNMPERWITRGPFVHAPHGHMECTDCHAKALVSSKTADINMPTMAQCAECHRPLQHGTATPAVARGDQIRKNPELVLQQRTEGGISAECQYCHTRYHASQDSLVVLNSQKPPAKAPAPAGAGAGAPAAKTGAASGDAAGADAAPVKK